MEDGRPVAESINEDSQLNGGMMLPPEPYLRSPNIIFRGHLVV